MEWYKWLEVVGFAWMFISQVQVEREFRQLHERITRQDELLREEMSHRLAELRRDLGEIRARIDRDFVRKPDASPFPL